ncbi:MAG: diacylglycerol kinase family lipid kinase [Opitutaceae bacterium]|nr:diacylglycerol kinase family lipid kinase [Opitutaceae bacterium]
MKIRLIHNPRSGPARRQRAVCERLRAALAAQGFAGASDQTRGPGDATRLAREAVAAGCTHVVAVGGDGTVNEVAAALAGTAATLAIVPAGSGNGLARHLGIPRDPAKALTLLQPGRGKIEAIDTATANGHFFCNAMGFGFDADVAARFCLQPRRGLGGYLRAAWRAWRERAPESCRIESASGSWTQDVLLLAVANSDQYGNDVRIAPGAGVRDGALDLVAISPVGAGGLVLLLARLATGKLLRSPRVRHARAAEFRLTRLRAGLIHLDGEVRATAAEIAVCVQAGNLRVLLPKARG